MKCGLKIVLMVLVLLINAKAAYLSNIPVSVKQADGSTLNLLSSGDEFFNRLHDDADYTIMQAADGYYYYAQKQSGKLLPSKIRVGDRNAVPAEITPGLKISFEAYQQAKAEFYQSESKNGNKAPHQGTLNNLVVYIRFSDQQEYNQPRSYFDNILNDRTAGANSVYNYYKEVSYDKLTLQSYHYPNSALNTNLSYRDIYNRSYYSPYNYSTNPGGYQNNNDRIAREHALLKRAVEYVRSQIPAGLNIDGDNDGYVDNVSFIVRGTTDGWSSLLWPHRWSLFTYDVRINNKRVSDYIFMLSDNPGYLNRNVFCHELFHALGAPDLYHYSSDGKVPVGPWDIMESGSGHMGAYMKWKYAGQKWISNIPQITQPGTYQLNSLTSSSNNCFKIASSNANEFFILEFRQKSGTFENGLPGTGLLVYRINTNYSGNANSSDEVYLYRPNGTVSQNGDIYRANYTAGTGISMMNANTNPSPFLTNGSQSGLKLSNISVNGNVVSFTYGDPVNIPVVNITSPANNSQFTIGAVVPVNAEVTGSGISRTEFYVNNTLKYTDNYAPYNYNWNTTGLTAQTAQVKVVAYNSTGQSSSKQISVNLISTPSSTVLLEQNFEGSIDGWYINATGAWNINNTGGVGNSRCARALYIPAGEKIINSPQVYIPANRNVVLTYFWKNNDIAKNNQPTGSFDIVKDSVNADKVQGQDITYLEISTDGGTNWNSLSWLYPEAAQSDYVNVNLDLSGYAGQTVRFRWRYWTNGSDYAYGVGVDNIKLTALDNGGSSSVESNSNPADSKLLYSYPNPFNNATSINYKVVYGGEVELSIYNAQGELVKKLMNGYKQPGCYSISFDASALNTGMYICHLKTKSSTAISKLLLVK